MLEAVSTKRASTKESACTEDAQHQDQYQGKDVQRRVVRRPLLSGTAFWSLAFILSSLQLSPEHLEGNVRP